MQTLADGISAPQCALFFAACKNQKVTGTFLVLARDSVTSNTEGVKIRRYQEGEEPAIWALYFDTTHKINGQDYTQKQCERWAPEDKDPAEWANQLRKTNPFVAVSENQIVGFGELEPNGHINMFYCHWQWQGKGAGSALMQAIVAEALNLGVKKLFTEVSQSAIGFFKSKGFEVVEERTNMVCDAPAKQFLAEMHLK